MDHVRKGCLVRQNQNIKTDGSRVENFNKGINGLQHSVSAGIVTMSSLTHDFILRRNVRMTTRNNALISTSDNFIQSCHKSHHLSLIDWSAELCNKYIRQQKFQLTLSPRFENISSGESFGLVQSPHVLSGDSVKQEALQEFAFEDDPDVSLDTSYLEQLQADLAVELDVPLQAFQQPIAGSSAPAPAPSVPVIEPTEPLISATTSTSVINAPQKRSLDTPSSSERA